MQPLNLTNVSLLCYTLWTHSNPTAPSFVNWEAWCSEDTALNCLFQNLFPEENSKMERSKKGTTLLKVETNDPYWHPLLPLVSNVTMMSTFTSFVENDSSWHPPLRLMSIVTIMSTMTSFQSWFSGLLSLLKKFLLSYRCRFSRKVLKGSNSNHIFLCKKTREINMNCRKFELILEEYQEWQMETIATCEDLLRVNTPLFQNNIAESFKYFEILHLKTSKL